MEGIRIIFFNLMLKYIEYGNGYRYGIKVIFYKNESVHLLWEQYIYLSKLGIYISFFNSI